jgi:transcriptional regulator with XRE-family HTH domain
MLIFLIVKFTALRYKTLREGLGMVEKDEKATAKRYRTRRAQAEDSAPVKTREELNELIRKAQAEDEIKLSGSELKAFRLEYGMSQEELGNLFDLSIDTIQRMESKEKIESIIIIIALFLLRGEAKKLDKAELQEYCEGMRMTGEELKKERKALGLSQEKLARKLGVSFATVNRWETGKVDISTMPIIGMAIEYLKNSTQARREHAA